MERSAFQLIQLDSVDYYRLEEGFFSPGLSLSYSLLLYVDMGPLHHVCEGKDTVMDQGDLFVQDAGPWHMIYADVDVAPRVVCVGFQGKGCGALSGHVFRKNQAAMELLRKIALEKENADPYSHSMCEAILAQLLLTLLRTPEGDAGRLQTPRTIRGESTIVRQAQQYIASHLRERLSVSVVAQRIDVSPSYMTALFQKHLSISPAEYIRRVKLHECKYLIREGELNFTEIAEAMQYSTVHHFSRQFKDKFGMTPTEYARSVRGTPIKKFEER